MHVEVFFERATQTFEVLGVSSMVVGFLFAFGLAGNTRICQPSSLAALCRSLNWSTLVRKLESTNAAITFARGSNSFSTPSRFGSITALMKLTHVVSSKAIAALNQPQHTFAFPYAACAADQDANT